MPISLTNASFRYPDGTLAVDDVTLEIGDGERVAVVGQNGAGKTTTVKMMNGLFKPTSGSVRVDGESTADKTTATIAKKVGYVFQNPDDQIFAGQVRGELGYMPHYYKWDEQKTQRRMTRAAKLTGLSGFLDMNPNDLPFAIKKFVAIAAVLVGECRYVILDEPTAGLDSRGLRLLNRMLDRLQQEGVGVVTITHDMRFVAESFSRVVVMANHTVIADGSCTEVFADDELLDKARLRRPEVAQLAHDLGLGRELLRWQELLPLIP